MTAARDIAAAVCTGRRSAREVLEEHLAVIDAREAELHAFNLVLADEARAAADALEARVAAGEDPGPLAGVPVAVGTMDELRSLGTAGDAASGAGSSLEDIFLGLTGGTEYAEIAEVLG